METYGHSLTEMEAHVAAVKVCVCVYVCVLMLKPCILLLTKPATMEAK